MWQKQLDDASLTKGVFLAFIILLFHVGMLLLVALLVVFFGFIIQYFAWILLGLGLVIGATIFYIVYTLKKQSSGIAEIMQSPEFRGKNVELRLFGGLASVKVTDSEAHTRILGYDDRTEYGPPEARFLESPDSSRVRELSELARLLENDYITPEEYQQTKNEIFNR